ncbi:MAG: FHA domain-containing protein [Lachnospiraceae bacterium]|nr:FHA domain-containing protein [Lachnospiraceae bacterium]
MLEPRYFRDYKHSYIILRCELAQPDKSYQCKLLTSDKIGEILRCSLRHVNGESYFYYEISSKTTLENLYHDRQMSFEQVRDLLEQLYGIYCKLGDYFMEETKLVLLPRFIYYDLTRKKYIGLYYPDHEEERFGEELMNFLLDHTDNQDERLINCVYEMYERMEEGSFTLEDALWLLGEAERGKGGQEKPVTVFPTDTVSKAESFQSVYPQEFSEISEMSVREDAPSFQEKGEKAFTRRKKKSLCYPCLAVFSILGIAGIACVYGFYELSEEEILTLFGCGGVMGVCLLVGLAGIVKGGVKEVRKKEARDDYGEMTEEKSFATAEIVSLENVLSRDMDMPKNMPLERSERGGFEGRVIETEEQQCGNTVFFDGARTAEYKLYALDKRNKKHIELTRFPYTVGKMAGCVDCVLTDDSISRIHARFEKVGDTIQLTDMNSTNGTYRNGLRMQPQETVEIEPGDEIRFGNLNYCYR